MNGVASAAMRQTADYRVNFGVELPRLHELAAQYGKDAELANALWKEAVRECRIMATMIFPAEEMDSEMADVWINSIHTAELAQVASINLFQHMKDATPTVLQWIATENETTVLCGLCTAYHLMRQGKPDTRQAQELQDQALSLTDSSNIAIRRVANNVAKLKVES